LRRAQLKYAIEYNHITKNGFDCWYQIKKDKQIHHVAKNKIEVSVYRIKEG
jgi:hypothetical protein